MPTGHSPDVMRWLDPGKFIRKQVRNNRLSGSGSGGGGAAAAGSLNLGADGSRVNNSINSQKWVTFLNLYRVLASDFPRMTIAM